MDATGCLKHLYYSRTSINCLIINATNITVHITDYGKLINQRHCGQFPSHGYKQINDLLDSIVVDLLYINSFLVNIFLISSMTHYPQTVFWKKRQRKVE